jgi:hypothetical protein
MLDLLRSRSCTKIKRLSCFLFPQMLTDINGILEWMSDTLSGGTEVQPLYTLP